MSLRKMTALAGAFALLLGMSACTGNNEEAGDGSSGGDTLRLWHYEGANSAMAVAWDEAIKIFEQETGAKVEFEERGFEQIRQTASQALNSDEAPDILEYNKGNATAGLLASQGLLEPLDDAVAKYGWDEKLAPSLQTTGKYDEDGVMGAGQWYGVTNYGEYVQVYYNKDMFKEAGIEVPKTMADFEAAMQSFVDKGVTPLAVGAAEYPLGQLWYQLALSKADRDFVDAYQLYTAEVDWQGDELTHASKTVEDWVAKGYISKDATGMKAEDAGVGFLNGTYPMFYSGSWWYGRFMDEAQMDWGVFLFPEAKLTTGSSGNLWVVPTKSKNKELAYKFIDITLRPEIQAIIGNKGGVPVAADPADIKDEKSLELIKNFNTVLEADGLAFYPDWPTPTFYDQLNAALQGLLNGTMDATQVNQQLHDDYVEGLPVEPGR